MSCMMKRCYEFKEYITVWQIKMDHKNKNKRTGFLRNRHKVITLISGIKK